MAQAYCAAAVIPILLFRHSDYSDRLLGHNNSTLCSQTLLAIIAKECARAKQHYRETPAWEERAAF